MVRTTASATTSAAARKSSADKKQVRARSPKSAEQATQVVAAPAPVEIKKNLIKKEPSAIRLDEGFAAGSLINVLRSYYRMHPVIDGQKKRTVNIHLASDDSVANTVDLLDYKGLFAFIQSYIKHHQIPLEVRNAEENPVPFSMSEVIESVFDMRLRGALHIADVYKGKANTDEMRRVMEDSVLPDLGFERDAATDLAGYFTALQEFINNDERIKTKVYNTVFPHTVHRDNELPKGVNIIYLRNMCRFDGAVLDFVINNDFDTNKLCKVVVKEYINSINKHICKLFLRKG